MFKRPYAVSAWWLSTSDGLGSGSSVGKASVDDSSCFDSGRQCYTWQVWEWPTALSLKSFWRSTRPGTWASRCVCSVGRQGLCSSVLPRLLSVFEDLQAQLRGSSKKWQRLSNSLSEIHFFHTKRCGLNRDAWRVWWINTSKTVVDEFKMTRNGSDYDIYNAKPK